MTRLPWPPASAKYLLTGLGIDFGILDGWLTNVGWIPPIGSAGLDVAVRMHADGVLPEPAISDANSRATSAEPFDLGDSPGAGSGLGSHTQTLEAVESNAGSFVSPGIPLASAVDSRLNPIGIVDGEAGATVHRGGTSFDTVTTNAFGFRHDADAGSGGGNAVKATASAPVAAVGGIAATRMDAPVATSGLLAASATPTVVESRVAAAGDDVEERTASGGKSNNVNDLELGFDGTSGHTVGLRFTGLDIPQGAVITNAYIQFRTDEAQTGTASLLIRGEDTDDANPFTAASFNVAARTKTDASAAWTPVPWATAGEAGLAQRTPDLTAIVQEIVNRSGWAALNDMAFIVTGTGTRTATSYEKLAAGAPLLHIEYQMPGQAGTPVAFNVPADADATANQIAELATAGTAVGIIASASDPDAGSSVTYSLNDTRFVIDAATGVITRSATGTLNFETQASINLTVTATSSDGSVANQSFTLGVLDSPEAVAFNAQPDANAATNRIAQNAAAGTAVGVTASAKDPDAGASVIYSLNDTRFVIDAATGVITRSSTGTLNAQAEPSITLNVTATSSDGSTDTHAYTVGVSSSQRPNSLTLVDTILTSQWSPASPDPSDIVYISHLGTLLVSDSEVDEMPRLFTGKNLYQMSPNGTLVGTLTTVNFSDEPAGIAYNPVNRHLFFADDTGTKSVYELNPGQDGLYNTSDDVVTSFTTSAFGSKDPEGIAYDTNRGVLYLADSGSRLIYTIAPGANGKFDGIASTGGDDIVTSFSVRSLGSPSDQSVAYDPVNDLLYLITSRTSVAMMTPAGTLVGTLDISAADARRPAGLALAPSSNDPGHSSLYIVDRGADNDGNPNENDGKIYEFSIDNWLLA